jgi:SAM-dependent methyltransferase
MLGYFRRAARKSKIAIVAFKICDNWRIKRQLSRGRVETSHGSTHLSLATAESLSYINSQFEDYMSYAGLTEADLQGKTLLELGCGDNVGLALRFIAAGVARAICVDKFYSRRDPVQQREIYLALRNSLTPEQQRRCDEAISLEDGIQLQPHRLQLLYGTSLAQAASSLDSIPKQFDFVVSRAVLEEIWDLDSVFQEMDLVLAPGGYTLHKIDLSDYGMFSGAGMNPLTFLTIPDSVYRLMASDSGIPNRRLIGYYRSKMRALGYEARFFITAVGGKGELIPHKEALVLGEDYTESDLAMIERLRPRLTKTYRELSAESLLVSGIFLVGRKPRNTW